MLTLLCFAHMGLTTMDMSVQAMAPCHETETTNKTAKECDACIIALNSWSENYVEANNVKIPEVVFAQINEALIFKTAVNITAITHQVYQPPQQVIWVNAFHIPQRSTVIIV